MALASSMKKITRTYERYRKNYLKYAKIIKNTAIKYFGNNFLALYVFGSVVRGDYKPQSDIDIAIVLKTKVDEFERAKFRILVEKRIGELFPFEIHIIDSETWEKYYKKLIKSHCSQIC